MSTPTIPPPLPSTTRIKAASAKKNLPEDKASHVLPDASKPSHFTPATTNGTERFQGVSSWLVSAVVHLVVVLSLALITIPVRSGMFASITLTLNEGNEASQPEFSLSQYEKVSLEPSPLVDPLPVEESFDLIRDVALPEVPQSNLGELARSLPQAAQVSFPIGGDTGEKDQAMFFGTSASGRTFVFILDCSGSMQARGGERFDRARDELVNSISRLSVDQEFYVYLFNWSTMPMFGTTFDPGKPIPATSENVAKLRSWLYNVIPNSGTDPRRALLGAYQLAPDAIFLLSDGRFNSPPYTDPLLGWDSSQIAVKDVVSAHPTVRINAIAFEDIIASRGMEELAEFTGGQYRFVSEPHLDFENESALINPLPEFDGPETTPVTPQEKRELSEKILLLRRAEKLRLKGRRQNAIDLIKEIDPLSLPIEFRKRLAAIYR